LATDVAVILGVMKGERPRRPEKSPGSGRAMSDSLWSIVQRCWAQIPSERPSIASVVQALEQGDANDLDPLHRTKETHIIPEESSKPIDYQNLV